jgi:hypothetical protein
LEWTAIRLRVALAARVAESASATLLVCVVGVRVLLLAMMLVAGVSAFAKLMLMIVTVGHLLAATITLSLAAERWLRVLALFPAGHSLPSRSVATTFGTAVARRAHSAFSRAATTAATTTTTSTAAATRLTGTVSTLAAGGSITATLSVVYASIARATC